MNRPRPRLTYANVVATLALLIAVGGSTAFAASQLGKNTVGPTQLRKNAVTTVKVKKEAITAAKVKSGSLTGSQIDPSTLGTVPVADAAKTANVATTANVANAVAPPEAWHEVGTPGEPAFQNKWTNAPASAKIYETVGYYKDRAGVVHLRGLVEKGTPEKTIFGLPVGYRPAEGKVVIGVGFCALGCVGSSTSVVVAGTEVEGAEDGAVQSGEGATNVSLDGISFRAEN